MACSCCFSLGGNLDFPDLLHKMFFNINCRNRCHKQTSKDSYSNYSIKNISLWLVKTSHMTCSIQCECFISFCNFFMTLVLGWSERGKFLCGNCEFLGKIPNQLYVPSNPSIWVQYFLLLYNLAKSCLRKRCKKRLNSAVETNKNDISCLKY